MIDRVIFHRGRRLGDDEWIFGYFFVGMNGNRLIMHIEHGHQVSDVVWPGSVGQYIGLKDKHDTKIFEGDYVEIDGEDGQFLVHWDEDNARFELLGDEFVYDFESFYSRALTVIGNRFDNPMEVV